MSTISHMIQSSLFPQLRLIAGENGFYRKISGINILEKEELTIFCRPNELIVTTGVYIANDKDFLEQLVKVAYENARPASSSIQGPISRIYPAVSSILQTNMSIHCSKWIGSIALQTS